GAAVAGPGGWRGRGGCRAGARQRRAGGAGHGGIADAAGPRPVRRVVAGAGGTGGVAVLRPVRPLPEGAADGPGLRLPDPQPPPPARPGERDAVVRVRPAVEGLFLGTADGGVRPVPRVLPRHGPAWATVASAGPDGGVPGGDRRFGGAVADQQPDGDAGG